MNSKRTFIVMMVLLVTTVMISLAPAFAQVDTAWVRRYGGSAYAIAVDVSGNVYVTGSSGTIKYNTDGDTLWSGLWGGTDIAIDGSGNVYVTGDKAAEEFVTIKYYANGDTAWVRSYYDVGMAIAVDDSGYVYVTGYGDNGLTYDDYVTIKYDPNGNVEPGWPQRYDGLGNYNDEANDIAVDASGNIYVTGFSYGLYWEDYATIKYYPNGDTAWVRRYDGPISWSDSAFAIAVDDSNNVYVTGGSYSNTSLDYATIKYLPNGDVAPGWPRRYNGPGNNNDEAYAIAIDGSGNVCVTGYSYGSGTSMDYATIKYDPNGNIASGWPQRYNGPGNAIDIANAVSVDGSDNVCVTGKSRGSGTGWDYATIKYHPNGDTAWVRRYNRYGSSSDEANGIATDFCDNVYVTGKDVTIKYAWLCPGPYRIEEPSSWFHPPLKVTPGGSRNLVMKVFNCGCANLSYGVTSDNPSCIQVNASGTLPPKDSVTVTTIVSGSGVCSNKFICGNVILTTDEGGGKVDSFPVQAVVAKYPWYEDYYECPIDPATFNTIENGVLRYYTNANGEERVQDIGTQPETSYQVIFSGGTIVATTSGTDTIVGRFMRNDWRAGVRDKLYTNWCYLDSEPNFNILYTNNIFIMPPVPPCDMRWYWWEESKQIKIFMNTAPDLYKHLVIEYITVKRHDPPTWWPTQSPFTGYEDTYIGVAEDIDCPSDTLGKKGLNLGGCRNQAGYDVNNHIAWQLGYGTEHPEYSNYYTGIALANGGTPGESIIPYGSYNIRNDQYLQPQNGWGWKDGELYRLAATEDHPIQDQGYAIDRSQVFTARKINAGNDPNASFSYTVVMVVAPGGLTQLQQFVDSARTIVTRERTLEAWPPMCGDVNSDSIVALGDVVYLITYLYKGGPAPKCPILRADVNNSCQVELGDVVSLISYVYKNGSIPKCCGVW